MSADSMETNTELRQKNNKKTKPIKQRTTIGPCYTLAYVQMNASQRAYDRDSVHTSYHHYSHSHAMKPAQLPNNRRWDKENVVEY
jgi:hypothetical protein